MKMFIKVISFVGLVLTLIPAFLVFCGTTTLDLCKILMLIGSVIWFVTAPSWMNESDTKS